MIEINSVISCRSDEAQLFDGFIRFLGVNDQRVACVIRMDVSPLISPYHIPFDQLLNAAEADCLELNFDYQTNFLNDKNALTADVQERLEKNLNRIRPLMSNQDLLFDFEAMNKEIASCAKKEFVSERTIKRLFYKYLWGGQNELVLAPAYHRCGCGKQESGTKRRGLKKEGGSSIVLADVREKLERSARIFCINGNHTIKSGYVEMLKLYSRNGVIHSESGGVISLEVLLLPESERPSERQFRYIHDLLAKKLGKTKGRGKRIRPKKEVTIILGKHRSDLLGPGHRFEIDATKVQVQLVSAYGRANNVGEATLYIVVDVWSGTIVGYALELENASWALAARALFNCFTDKTTILNRLGLSAGPDVWPCHHLPTRLTADRGEMISNNAGAVPDIGIPLNICPSMCPEKKVSVESKFGEIKHRHGNDKLPGSHRKNPGRREDNGKKSAALTLFELEKIVVQTILSLNNEPVPVDNIPPELISSGEDDITHIGLYAWGIKNLPGHTRTLPEDVIYTSLLARETASVTNRGIRFKKQYFTSQELISNGMQLKAANKRFKIEVRYDKYIASHIWFYNSETNKWLMALNSDEEIRRLSTSFIELDKYYKEVEELHRAKKYESEHQSNEAQKEIQEIVDHAIQEKKDSNGASGGLVGNQLIRANKALEITANRQIKEGLIRSTLAGLDFSTKQAAMVVIDEEQRPLLEGDFSEKLQKKWESK